MIHTLQCYCNKTRQKTAVAHFIAQFIAYRFTLYNATVIKGGKNQPLLVL